MRLDRSWTACVMIALGLLANTMATGFAAGQAGVSDSAAWREPYKGHHVAGPDVIAFWGFDMEQPGYDTSGQHALRLRGSASRFVPDDRFGGVLIVDAGEDDSRQGAAAADHDALSPTGAFTIEAWIRPAEGLADRQLAYIVDKKLFHYVSSSERANRDYLMLLSGRPGQWQRSLMVSLGFGEDSETYTSQPLTLEPGRWVHVAFSYDGQGLGVFYANGHEVGRKQAQRGPIAPGSHPLVIGDRLGSTHHRFVGSIAQVRLSSTARVFNSGQASVSLPPARHAFARMEDNATLPMVVTNDTGRDLNDVLLRVVLEDQAAVTLAVGSLNNGQKRELAYPVDTSLAAGQYALQAHVVHQGKVISEAARADLHIVNRPPAGQMPIIMWGNGSPEPIKAMGFNHQLVNLVSFMPIWLAREPVADPPEVARRRLAMLDGLLIHQMGGVHFFNSINWLKRQAVNQPDPEDNFESYQAIDQEGNPHLYGGGGVLDPTFPRIKDMVRHLAEAVAQQYGSHPALVGALIHSEVRDSTQISYHEHNQAAYRQETGYDYPPNLAGPRGTHHRQIRDFPLDRVVPDDHPLLRFYRWFWRDGDGWNKLHESAAAGFKSGLRDDLWTFYDPAVRVPSLYGSGGNMDVISQWTYTYPDPIKIGLATDELFAMAHGTPGQQVMTMTQAIWYRSRTAPIAKPDATDAPAPAPWEQREPDARYITIAPDIARQSLWLMLSRPVKGIMFHGLSSLLPREVHGGWQGGSYVFTNEQTHQTLADDMARFVHPLGPALMQVGDRPADIAFLESFTSQMLAARGGYGWATGWSADSYLVLQWARLQPRVIYEQTLLDAGLDAYQILVLTDCDVLPRSVVTAIRQWQDQGGIIIGDERLTPAIQPDVVLPSYRRTQQADKDKAHLVALAQELRAELQGQYQGYVDSSSPDLIVRARQWQDADYLFVINDHRRFGDYVGHHGLVMEQGLPQAGQVMVNRAQGFLYDVLESQQIQPQHQDGAMRWPVSLQPGDGKLFLITPQPIAAVTLQGPLQTSPGQRVTWESRVVDAQGEPVQAVLPVRVDITDAQGDPAEFTGYHRADAGRLTLTLDIPANAAPGAWTVRVRDLASGRVAVQTFTVTPR